MEGKLIQGEHTYQNKVAVKPVPHYYDEDKKYVKYRCPICEQFGSRHSIWEGAPNCPICNVNLEW